MTQEELASPPAVNTAAASYAAATQTLRTTVRWLITAAAAVGGALVAGLGVKGLGPLSFNDWPRLTAATLGMVAALASVGYMITRASRILTDEWITLAQLSLAEFQAKVRESATLRGLFRELDDYKDELYADVADNIPELYARLQAANKVDRERPSQSFDAAKESAALRPAVGAVVQFANYYSTREKYKALNRQLAGAAGVVVIGMFAFGYATNLPVPNNPSSPPNNGAAASPPLPSSQSTGSPCIATQPPPRPSR